MSLVQEALKRKNAEQNTPEPEPSPAPPPESAPPVHANLPDVPIPEKSRKNLIDALVLLLFLAFLSAAAYGVYFLLEQRGRNRDVAQAPPPKTEQPAEAPDERKPSRPRELLDRARETIETKNDMHKEGETVMETPAITPKPEAPPPAPPVVEAPAVQDEKPVAVRPAAREPGAPPPPAVARTAPDETRAAPAPDVVQEKTEPVIWPLIRLKGVMVKRHRPTEGLAILNNRQIAGGQSIEGVKLVSVHPDGVILEYKGEIKTLRVGAELR